MLSINFDIKNKRANWCDYDSLKKYKGSFGIGEQLVEFLDINFDEYEKSRILVSDAIKDDASFQKVIDKIDKMDSCEQGLEIDLFMPPDMAKNIDKKKRAEIWSAYGLLRFLLESSRHLYIGNCSMKIIYDVPLYDILKKDFNVLKMQEECLDAIEFCMDIDYLKDLLGELSAVERYILYVESYRAGHFFNYEYDNNILKSNFSFQNIDNKEINHDLLHEPYNDELDSNPEPKQLTPTIIEHIKNLSIDYKEVYEPFNIRDFLFLEFTKMIESNLKMRKCDNCGRYFILKGNYNTRYCDRIFEGEKRTCQAIASANNYSEKVNGTPVLKEYNRAYKRYFARYRNKRMSYSDFHEWSEQAKAKRELALNGEMNFDDFVAWLGNKKVKEGN